METPETRELVAITSARASLIECELCQLPIEAEPQRLRVVMADGKAGGEDIGLVCGDCAEWAQEPSAELEVVNARVRIFSRPDEAGQGLAEYALILALIAIVAVVALVFLGDAIASELQKVADAI